MPFRPPPADIELTPSVFHSRTPLRDRAVRPKERLTTRITTRAGDENRLEIKILREARPSWLAENSFTVHYADPDDSFHPHPLLRLGISYSTDASISMV